MNTLTMVMRCGEKKAPAASMLYTLIAEDYSFVRMSGEELAKAIQSKKVHVTNMGVTAKGLVATNGALDKYTLVSASSGVIVGKASPVVLNRAEADGKLIGYTIYNTDGVLQEVSVKQALMIHQVTPFANGKIRHTADGDIIQSIEGNYIIRKIEVKKAKAGKVKIDLVFIGSAIGNGKGAKYAGVVVNCDNAADISKLYKTLLTQGKTTVEQVYAISKDIAVKDELAVKRTGTAGFYGVYPIKTVEELIKKADNTVSNGIGKIMVSTIDYDDDKAESRVTLAVTLSNELKPIGKITGSDKSEKALKKYLEEVLTFLKGVKVTV